jgi:acyl-CoA thioesterase YciA
MDLAGGDYAAEYAHGRVATVGTEATRFLRPVSVGDEVSWYCSLVRAGATSIALEVETRTRGRGRGRPPEKDTKGVFTFVTIGEDGHPSAALDED